MLGKKVWLACTSALALTCAWSLEAAAQSAGGAVEEVVVTGSRIKRKDLSSTSPVSTVSRESIERAGTPNVEEILNTLPQLVAGATKSTNNAGASDATASLNLRGLGAQRTLIMVNGRRFMPSSQDGVVDINNIPASLIDRVEVVTGGASAVYGSDAMAGVVNFILRDKFEGVEANANYGVSGHGDGRTYDVNATVGAVSANGRAYGWLYAGYEDRDALLARERNFSKVQMVDTNGTFTPTGSLSIPGGMLVSVDVRDPSGTGFVKRNLALDAAGNPRIAGASDIYNAQADFLLQLPLKRTSVASNFKYELTDKVRAFVEASYNSIESNTQFSRVGPNIRDTVTAPAMPYNASWISPSLAALLAARPDPKAPLNVRFLAPEGFPERQKQYDREYYRFVTGVEGKLGQTWSWDASFSYSRLSTKEVLIGDISRSAVVEASLRDPANPARCASGNPQCVPLTSLSAWTPEQIKFLRHDLNNAMTMSEKVVGVHATGDVITLPGGPLGVALGAEYRRSSSDDRPDRLLQNFDSAGYAERNPSAGAYDVREVFGEGNLPLISDAPFAKYVGLEFGARYSDYSSSGSVWTYKYGGSWAPNEDIRFRGVFQRAVRAPNVRELFGGQIQSFPVLTDPCSASRNPTGSVAALCVAQGVPASQIGKYQQPSATIEARSVANPALRPEKSDTFTIGTVLTPHFLPGLNVTLDYYDIKIDDAIDRLGGGAQGALSGCFAALDISNPFCRTFRRSALTYEIVDFRIPLANVASLHTRGLDFSAAYRFELDKLGLRGDTAHLTLGFASTWVMKNSLQSSATSAEVDRAGTVGVNSNSADPTFRAVFTANYDSAGFGVQWRTRFLDSVKDAALLAAELRGAANPSAGIARPTVPAYWYHDVDFSYEINSNYRVNFGVRNLFDKDPPLLSTAIEANTDPNTYDPVGRYFYMGVKARF